MEKKNEKKKERLSQLVGGAVMLGYAAYRQYPAYSKHIKKCVKKYKDLEPALKQAPDPSIARPGEQVVALEDVPGRGLTYDIHKGERYTVRAYCRDSYSFEECPPEYEPYLGEIAARWFSAENFRRLAPEEEPEG